MICANCGGAFEQWSVRPEWPKCEPCTMQPKAARKAEERKAEMLAAIKRKRSGR